jgi:5-methylcytosine-specific restriction protein A
MLKKFCNAPGCRNLCDIEQRYCEEHSCLEKDQEADRQRRYDKAVRHSRDKQYSDFYSSPEWQAVRNAAVARDKALCVLCMREGKVKPFHTVHHIIPIKDDWCKRLSLDNLICVCERHHQQLHKEMIMGQGWSKK